MEAMNRRADFTPEALEALFRPRALAVVGATERAGSVGRAVMENLIAAGFEGSLYPVNPKADRILGVPAFASLAHLPGRADAAVVMVPSDAVPAVIGECAAAGIRAAVVISAGFKECGDAGRKREAALRAAAEAGGVAVLGPNCLGLINTGIGLDATFARRRPAAGNISFLSQSGALGVYALEFAAANDIGIRLFASLGNKAVLDENHVLEAFGRDSGTRVILAYLEDFRDPEAFFRQAEAIASGPTPKPIVLLKAGTGKSGRRAAGSHTGALAEKADFLSDLCIQAGVIRAETLEGMFDAALCLADQPLPAGPRVAILTNAGGPAILAADEAERRGLAVPEPGAVLRSELAGGLPEAAGLGNPIDVLGDADAGRYADALGKLVRAPEYDSILAISTPQSMTSMDGIARALEAIAPLARQEGKPMVAALARFGAPSPADRILDECGIPDYPFPENAVQALAEAWRHRRWRDRDQATRAIPLDRNAISLVLEGARAQGRKVLTPPEARTVLNGCGFVLAECFLAAEAGDLAAGGAAVGFPLVAKLISPEILHKTDAGGVTMDIRDPLELRQEFRRMHALADRLGATFQGVLLQRQITGGLEILAGAHRHPHFGPLIGFGLGGILVEALADVRFRHAPLTAWDAGEMICGIRAAAALGAFRGRAPRDYAALEHCLLALSALMEGFPGISEIDLNPVFALETGAVVADARILLGP